MSAGGNLLTTEAQFGDAPKPRSGHSATYVGNDIVVLFGGTAGDHGHCQITNDCYQLDLLTMMWSKIVAQFAPPARAEHGAAKVDTMQLVIYGGSAGAGGLSSEDLYVLDFRSDSDQLKWLTVPIAGTTPGRRYAHTIVHNKPHLIVFGGNDGRQCLKDIWYMDVQRSPFQWNEVVLPVNSKGPDERMYHAAEVCREGPATGMMVIFGGRNNKKMMLPDVWGLRQRRDGQWDWKLAPVKKLPSSPNPRFQHTVAFIGPKMFVVGGRESDVGTPLYDTQQCVWTTDLPSVGRYGHASWAWGQCVYIFGGLRGNQPESQTPTGDLQRLELRDHRTSVSRNEIADRFLASLLRPNISADQTRRDYNSECSFCLPASEINLLIDHCMPLFQQEDTLLTLTPPIKVYGDIHGQYYDLMRLFGIYRAPISEDWLRDFKAKFPDNKGGDIDSHAYLFLGDFVDRGPNSLEVICLLLALKLKFPTQFHLIRGNHEDAPVNGDHGFSEECRRRLGEQSEERDSVYHRMNELFELLPLAAMIDNKILCVHGGIGKAVRRLDDIRKIQRPVKVTLMPSTPMEQHVLDLLWSDPTENDSVWGIHANARDEGSGYIVKFGPDVVVNFLQQNQLECIIRAHECVQDGFERFCEGRLITLFSATDYCNTHKNAGALLFIRRDLTMVPKIIYPTPAGVPWIKPLDSRPPTPPRMPGRVRTDFDDYN